MPDAEKKLLRERENAYAAQLIEQDRLLHIWRIVGRVANFSIWQAPDLEALHESIMSMPMFQYMKIDVIPMISHPMTDMAETRRKISR